jgi:glycine cleavage system aminomethyltransferase T
MGARGRADRCGCGGNVASGTREPGTEVEVGKIDGHQKRIPATVVRLPFYDPDKTRVRA